MRLYHGGKILVEWIMHQRNEFWMNVVKLIELIT